jgi:YbbR domain-containing protein
MSWITDDWRLKLLALLLAILMLGAVAFSQNPPTTGTVTVGLSYDTASNIVILNPPAQTRVTFSGLADVIGAVTTANVTAKVDATHASPGTGVKLNIQTTTSVAGITVQNPPPIVVNIDARATIALTVGVLAHAASDYHIVSASSTCAGVTPCVVHFDGPASWELPTGLQAEIVYTPAVAFTDIQQPSQPILLQTNTGPFNKSRVTQPSWTLDVSTADIHIVATPGVSSNSVVLVDSPPSNGPPPGYHVTGVAVSPITVVIAGDPAVLARNPRIYLPAVDLSIYTSTVTIKVNIPYPNGVTPVNGVVIASITYTIVRNPSVAPSP